MVGKSTAIIASIAVALIGISVFFLLEENPPSFTSDEIDALEQTQSVSRQVIKIYSNNLEFFEKWCTDLDGTWENRASGDGGLCHFDSKVKKEVAELEWERLQHPVIAGETAQKICNVVGLECPPDPKFEGWFDDNTGYVKLSYTIQDRDFSFRILGDSLEYSRNAFYDDWYSYDETFGQNASFELDDDYYFSGDVVNVSGFVWEHARKNPEMPVVLQVFFGNDLIEIAEVPVSSNGKFTYEIKTEGPLWQQSGIYTIAAFYDSGKSEKNFGFSTYYSDKQIKYFTELYSEDYEELCGYPVTLEMQKTFLESWKSRHDDKVSFLSLKQGVFSHVERSQYLTAIPILHYWYDLKGEKQIYFAMEACSLDDFLFYAEPDSNYEKPEEVVIKGVTYVELSAPGKPLIYKDTLLPVLDVDNCNRVAEESTEQQRKKIYLRENTSHDAPYANQIFPLMDYCTEIGDYIPSNVDGNIQWSFKEK